MMDVQPSSRSRSIDLPKPETGLAEWTSKIKAMQRQVDADDEAEQRKLEEEIAASRLARMRRSHGVGYGGKASSLDLSQNPEYAGVLKSDTPSNGGTDDLKYVERQTDQEDALRKLMGSKGLPSPTRPTQERKSTSPLAPSQPKPEAMSLAAFMGGRATGPRLNRHAPQQDAHDPSQFDQRKRNDVPHPVFGRGGVAMPGMTAKGWTSLLPETAPQNRNAFVRSRSSGPMLNHDEPPSFQVGTTPRAEPEGPPAVFPKPSDVHGSRERGTNISSGTPHARSPYVQPKETPSSAESGINGSSNLLHPSSENKKIISRSPSAGTSLYSRGKTPELSPTTDKPQPRPISRSYDSPSTHRGPSPSPTRPVEQPKDPPPPGKKPDPVSLAAFISGRATGPRLNRHAPQQDAHDPTQFDQRANITAPHPGMAIREGSSTRFRSSGQLRGAVDESHSLGRSEDHLPTSLNTWNGIGSRQRAISTPGGSTSGRGHSSQGDYIEPDDICHPTTQASIPDKQSKIPTNLMPPSSPPIVSRSYTPRQSGASTSPLSSSQQKASPVTTPSLARPILPVPRQSPTGPQIPQTKNPSRAFLRPPAEKEPTPSLSRLKGRGFVQNMIKTSSQLEASANEFGGTPSTNTARAAPRKSSVLDRWQPAVSTSSSATSTPISPKPIPIRKSRTMDQPSTPDATPSSFSPEPSSKPSKPASTNRSLKTVASLPAISSVDSPRPSSRASSSKQNDISINMPLQDTPGLGSSSTLISYIKPTKTGDDPLPPAIAAPSDVRSNLEGVGQGGKKSSTSELPVASGQPLKHPTKGRAKKPRKDRDAKQVQHQHIAGTDTSGKHLYGDLGRPAPEPAAHVQSFDTPHVSTPPGTSPPNANGKVEQSHTNLSSDNSQPPVSRICDRWADQAIIGVKPLSSKTSVESRSDLAESDANASFGRRALPGLTTSIPSPQTEISEQEEKPDKSPPTPLSPGRHKRIPSTGNRATVMNVAQAWNEQHVCPPYVTADLEPLGAQRDDTMQDESPEMIEKLAETIPQPRHMTPPNAQAEKRKSSYEQYSAVSLPSLPEEKTPATTPAGTLSRGVNQGHLEYRGADKYDPQDKLVPSSTRVPPVASLIDANLVYLDHVDQPLPQINIDALLNANAPAFIPNPYDSTISIDTMLIAKSTANSISKDANVFYDTEVLAIIHRSKSKSSGLVSTKVWSWQGKRCQCGDKEDRKLQELAKRYGTTLETAHQYQEPPELIQLLGGTVAIRQGIRAHWSPDNTTMHSVRSYNGSIFIEEHDLSVTNMCSGFSYCLTILDTFYVWYGCGSRQQERDAALQYAQGLAVKGATVVELAEGESDDDEMFWMMLGDDEYANADYWKWRRTAPEIAPRLWCVDTNQAEDACKFVISISGEMALQDSVYIIDCIWEYFVLVGQNARGKRRDLRLAISIAQQLSSRVASSRPFSPTIHTLILPSRLPLDLRLQFRGLDEAQLNHEAIPNHMNILSSAEALENLQRKSWNKATLRDHAMLPLGLDPSIIS